MSLHESRIRVVVGISRWWNLPSSHEMRTDGGGGGKSIETGWR